MGGKIRILLWFLLIVIVSLSVASAEFGYDSTSSEFGYDSNIVKGNITNNINQTVINQTVNATWGDIQGTLSDQTDLKNKLDSKYNSSNPFGFYNSTDFSISDYYLKNNPFGFYNSSDFSISDYFTKTQINNFNYYNSTDFSISDYFTKTEITGFNYYNSTDFSISDYYLKSNPFSFYNITNFPDNYLLNTGDTATGNYTFDTNTFFIDSSNNRVGIGTTSPSEKLDVVGSIVISAGSEYKYDGVRALILDKNSEAEYYSTLVGALAGNPGHASSTRQTAMGYYAGSSNTGAGQTATGFYAGRDNTGADQTAMGYAAGHLNEGAGQTVMGYYAGRSNTVARQTAMGYRAGQSNTGIHQTVMGYFAGRDNTGAYQTAMGYFAGRQNTGARVSGFGYEATYLNTANDVVAIGYQAGKSNSVANQFIVQQANINAVPLIQGDFSSGNVGIGTTSPLERLHISGNQTVSGSLALGSNKHKGLNSGDINASTIYYDTLTAKSPTFHCSEDWCSVGYPKHQKTLWIQKNETWGILNISYNGNYYTKQEFWNLVQGTQFEGLVLELNKKINRLQNKEVCLKSGYKWDGNCYEITKQSVSYSEAVESEPVYNTTSSTYTCTKLNETLQTYETNCTSTTETEEIIKYSYRFKEDCGWDGNYYCEVRSEVTI